MLNKGLVSRFGVPKVREYKVSILDLSEPISIILAIRTSGFR